MNKNLEKIIGSFDFCENKSAIAEELAFRKVSPNQRLSILNRMNKCHHIADAALLKKTGLGFKGISNYLNKVT